MTFKVKFARDHPHRKGHFRANTATPATAELLFNIHETATVLLVKKYLGASS